MHGRDEQAKGGSHQPIAVSSPSKYHVIPQGLTVASKLNRICVFQVSGRVCAVLVTRHSSLVNSAPGDAFLAGADVFCAATHTVKNALADSASRAKGTAQRKYATVVNYTCNQGWVGDGSMECKVRLPPRPHALPT